MNVLISGTAAAAGAYTMTGGIMTLFVRSDAAGDAVVSINGNSFTLFQDEAYLRLDIPSLDVLTVVSGTISYIGVG